MTAQEIRETHALIETPAFYLREIAAQLAELVEIQKYIIYGQPDKRPVK